MYFCVSLCIMYIGRWQNSSNTTAWTVVGFTARGVSVVTRRWTCSAINFLLIKRNAYYWRKKVVHKSQLMASKFFSSQQGWFMVLQALSQWTHDLGSSPIVWTQDGSQAFCELLNKWNECRFSDVLILMVK
jgi:hypothetical protein